MKGLILLFVVASMALVYADDRCPSEQESNWEIEKLLEHEDCNKFYKCTFGNPVEMSCFGDLYFNLETWRCDWRENVECGDRNDPALTTLAPETEAPVTTAEPETEPPTTEAPTTTPEPETEPPTTEAPTTTPEPETEPPTTEAPTTTPEPETEPPTTEAPTTTQEPETEPPTTDAPTTTAAPETEAPTTEPEEPEMELLPNGCPVDPHIHWLLPHEEDCNLFYYCVWGEKVLRQCPATLHFNRVLQVCDWPRDAGCTTSFNKHLLGRRLMSQVEVSLNL